MANILQYLINFSTLIYHRRKQAKYFHKKREVDRVLTTRIEKLFMVKLITKIKSQNNNFIKKI